MANVSLDKDLFYQYMINNNSTSTMLNALSGNTNTGVQSANDLSGVLGALQNSVSFGTGSISDVSTLLSGLEGISTTGTGNSFSDILQSYLQPTSDSAQTTDSVQYINGVESSDNMQAAVSDIQKQIGSEIQTTECDSVQTQAQQLLDEEVDAIIYNGAYTSLMEENVTDFSKKIKILYTFDIRVQLDFGNSGATDDSITKEPFTIYISGIDTYGEVSETSRSDVNLIAVVNPKTYQILLVTTPRDYYVPIPGVSGGQKDKLTHAGIYGIDASMRTLGELYETDINYYARLNFTSLIDIVDTLGGVDVYSELAFQTGTESGCIVDVQEGWNHLNGEQALAFSRERHALADGDNQRGKNQQAVLTAMLRKCLSPTMLLKAGTIMNQVSSEVETNLSQAQINSLIKYQLNKNATWTIQSVAATGTNDKGYCYSSGDIPLFIMDPDEDVVQEIIDLANVVEEGGTLKDGESLN